MSYKFSKQFISLDVTGPTGDLSITIETPHLVDGPDDVIGDWGPNCIFTIDPNDPLKVHYDINGNKEVSTISMEKLWFNSPHFFKQRSEFPFYIEFDDKAKEFSYTVHYDKDGQARKVDLKKLNESIEFENYPVQ